MAIEQFKPGQLVIDGVTFKGRTFDIEGQAIELYPIGALAKALGRTNFTMMKWEKEGLLPLPMFDVQGAGVCTRWYSREQIINMRKVLKMIPYRNGKSELKKPFRDGIHAVFYKLKEVSLEVKAE